MSPRDPDDDFVHTISDNDDEIPDLDGEPDTLAPAPAQHKKRKRDSDAPELNGSSKKRNKKSKKQHKESTPEPEVEAEDAERNWAADGEDDGAMASDFEFQIGDMTTGITEDFDGWEIEDGRKKGSNKKAVDIDEIIARRRQTQTQEQAEPESESDDGEFAGFDDNDETLADDAFGMAAQDADESGDEVEDESGSDEEEGSDASDRDDEEEDEDEDDDEDVAKPVAHPDDVESQSSDDEEEEDAVEAERKKAFFAPEDESIPKGTSKGKGSFQNMSLSRPILKGLAAVGFSDPTPIQEKTIPVALLGKDIVGGAVTGSGKTGAFVIPILERLLYRPKKVPTTRVAILVPTRELAVQCFKVSKKLAAFSDITFAQIVGGFSLREQEILLKQRPDVVIATPGRFIDHMRNSASFAVDTLEILVLDEADRMLEDGFADELNEILNTIPKSRQTMLFSATMTDSVDKLIRVGLNRPVRLMVDQKKATVSGLVQEFVRLRHGKEDKRMAVLMYLCKNVFTDRVIIFFRQKKEAHHARILFGLCGIKAAELHGSMSQEQRIHAVESFRNNQATHLLATDLASRGLDIKNVSTVLNYSAPQSHDIYLHRIGRTARGGASGRACTIAAEPDRKVVKAAVKAARAQGANAKVVSRQVPSDEMEAWAQKLEALEVEVEAVLKEEKEEKALAQAEMEVRKGDNIITHADEIMARPKRTWFESEKDKKAAKDAGWRQLNDEEGATVKVKGKGKVKLSNKERKRLEARDERKSEGGAGMGWKKGAKERAGKRALDDAKKAKKSKARGTPKPRAKGPGGKGRPPVKGKK